jgi:hypothetical protein
MVIIFIMTTAEDVLFLYERNNRYYNILEEDNYFEHDENGNEINLPIIPETIGNQYIKCNFKRKVYIKPGEECCICLDKIYTKTNAYLTGCGHSFHKKCLFKSYEVKRKSNPNCTLNCPLCRSNMGLDIKDLAYRYRYVSFNQLDNLENFWIKKDYMNCDICYNRDHYIGMKKNCNICKKYCDGELLFGL